MAEPKTFQELLTQFQHAPTEKKAAIRDKINRVDGLILNAFENASPEGLRAFRDSVARLAKENGGDYAAAIQTHFDLMRDSIVKAGSLDTLPKIAESQPPLEATEVRSRQVQTFRRLKETFTAEFVDNPSGKVNTADQIRNRIMQYQVPGIVPDLQNPPPALEYLLPALSSNDRAEITRDDRIQLAQFMGGAGGLDGGLPPLSPKDEDAIRNGTFFKKGPAKPTDRDGKAKRPDPSDRDDDPATKRGRRRGETGLGGVTLASVTFAPEDGEALPLGIKIQTIKSGGRGDVG